MEEMKETSSSLGPTMKRRLQNWINLEICDAENPEEYAGELRKLVDALDHERIREASILFQSLADETRLKLLGMLKEREMCVCELMVALGLTQPTASHHLNILKKAGLVEDRKLSRWVLYRLSESEHVDFLINSRLL